MIIANPIYDVVFKRLMEDNRIAKFFVETLVDEQITEIEVKPQEFTYSDQLAGLAVFRLDFIATIKTGEDHYKKVLIEIQKAKNPVDLMRFRNYLGEQYKKEDDVKTTEGKKKTVLPIITIYLLGFKLPDLDSAAIKVKRNYLDLLTHKVIEQKNDFIEKLTHDCFVVQLPRIQVKLLTRLEKLLSVFEQNFFVDDHGTIKQYNYEVEDEEIKKMIAILHFAGTDPDEKQKIENEQEAYRILDLAASEKSRELQGIITEQNKVLEEKNKSLLASAKALKESGIDLKKIMELTGLKEDVIENL
jgi:hypothetical protein